MTASRNHNSDLGVLGVPGDVSPWDVRFDPDDVKHVERITDDTIRFTVWTEPDLHEAWIVVRLPDGSVTGHAMTAWSKTGRFTYWESEVEVPGPMEYSFAFRSRDGSPVYLVPSGITTAVERLDRWHLDPQSVHHLETPAWARGALIYQVFPDRFANGDPSNDPPGAVAWGTEPHPRQFQGGDLVGVEQRLEYLDMLGVGAIYLNPIFASPSNHRYDTVDYFEVDLSLGGDEALRNLVQAAHRRGMRVILDASFNHVHPRFFAFRDLIERGSKSRYRNWFVVDDWPLRLLHRPHGWGRPRRPKEWLEVWAEQTGLPIETVDGPGPMIEPTYEAWYGVPTMPRVNLADPEARSYMLDVSTHWVREYDVDGWRMDVARYVDPDFWNDLRVAVKSVRSDAYLLAEIMGDAGAWLQGDRFDATMNYTFRSIALRFFAHDEIDGSELLDESARMIAQHPWAVTSVNHNLLGSHDTPRFRSEAGGDEWRLRLATIFQLLFPGAPGIYYGDEVGLVGGNDPGCRGAFPWQTDPAEHALARTIIDLVRIRRARRSLTAGRWVPRHGSGHTVAFDRVVGRERTTVVINRGARKSRVDLDRRVSVRWGEGTMVQGGIEVPGRSAAVLW